uniref:o-succinylbenzoate synthase n=1 Tax=Psychrobacillus sp. FSL H8-0483 TaxID=2921389 RepID=UPI00406C15EC
MTNQKIDIEKIILRKLKVRMKNPFKTSFGSQQDRQLYIVEVIDSKQRSGWGETVAGTFPWYSEETVETNRHIIEEVLIPLLRQAPISHPDELMERFSKVKGNNMAKAALEGAIWDLYARQNHMTLVEAIGGTKEKIEVGVSIGLQESEEKLLELVGTYIKLGYKRVKLKIEPGNDLEVVKSVRKAYPDINLMVDANSAYTLEDAEHLAKLDEFNLMMIEQPLAHNDIIDHSELQARIKTPICLDESLHSLEDVKKAIKLKSCKIVNLKIGRVGGISESKKIHDYCLENGISLWCGGMLELGIGRAHNIAITSLAGFDLPGDTSASSNYWDEDIISPEVTVENGLISIPSGHGIGYDINHETLRKFTIDEKIIEMQPSNASLS